MVRKYATQSDASKAAFAAIDATSADIEAIAKQVKRDVDKSVMHLTSYPNKAAATSSAIIAVGLEKQAALAASGFDEALKITVDAVDLYGLTFTEAELSKLAAKQSLLITDLAINSQTFDNKLKTALLQNISRKLTVTQAASILATTGTKYAPYSETLVKTGLQHFYKSTTWEKVRTNFDTFRYAGPSDSLNRPFCADHVGTTFDKEEADRLQEEIMTFYNCRHTIEPVVT